MCRVVHFILGWGFVILQRLFVRTRGRPLTATKGHMSGPLHRKSNQEQGFEEGCGQRLHGLWKFGGQREGTSFS